MYKVVNARYRKKSNHETCGCGNVLTEEHVTIVGTSSLGVWANCNQCNSTRLSRDKNAFKEIYFKGMKSLRRRDNEPYNLRIDSDSQT